MLIGKSSLLVFFHLRSPAQVSFVPCWCFPLSLGNVSLSGALWVSVDPVTAELRPKPRLWDQHNTQWKRWFTQTQGFLTLEWTKRTKKTIWLFYLSWNNFQWIVRRSHWISLQHLCSENDHNFSYRFFTCFLKYNLSDWFHIRCNKLNSYLGRCSSTYSDGERSIWKPPNTKFCYGFYGLFLSFFFVFVKRWLWKYAFNC